MVITRIMPLRQQKLRIGGPAVTAIAGNQFSVVGLLRICHIINNIADCLTLSAPLADMQGMMRVVAIDGASFLISREDIF